MFICSDAEDILRLFISLVIFLSSFSSLFTLKIKLIFLILFNYWLLTQAWLIYLLRAPLIQSSLSITFVFCLFVCWHLIKFSAQSLSPSSAFSEWHLDSFHFLHFNSFQVSDFHIWTATIKTFLFSSNSQLPLSSFTSTAFSSHTSADTSADFIFLFIHLNWH